MSQCPNGCDRDYPAGCSKLRGGCACDCHRVSAVAELLAVCKDALPHVENYIQGLPELAERMDAAIKRLEEAV